MRQIKDLVGLGDVADDAEWIPITYFDRPRRPRVCSYFFFEEY